MKAKLNMVRAHSVPCGPGRWKVMVSKAGRGLTDIGFISWMGKAHEIEFSDGRKDSQPYVKWDDAENRLLLEHLKNENQRTNETIALRTTRGQ